MGIMLLTSSPKCLLTQSAMREPGTIAAVQTEFPRPAEWVFYLLVLSLVDRSCYAVCSSPGLEPVEKALLPHISAAASEELPTFSY